MALEQFTWTDPPTKTRKPPKGAIASASWLSQLLRTELHHIENDPLLGTEERRGLILKYSKTIITATPNHEIFEAREAVRADEALLDNPKLSGETTSDVTTGGTRPLRAAVVGRRPGRPPVR